MKSPRKRIQPPPPNCASCDQKVTRDVAAAGRRDPEMLLPAFSVDLASCRKKTSSQLCMHPSQKGVCARAVASTLWWQWYKDHKHLDHLNQKHWTSTFNWLYRAVGSYMWIHLRMMESTHSITKIEILSFSLRLQKKSLEVNQNLFA